MFKRLYNHVACSLCQVALHGRPNFFVLTRLDIDPVMSPATLLLEAQEGRSFLFLSTTKLRLDADVDVDVVDET